ncbi:MAG TPA: hypothetical protein VFK27_06925, partial [Bacillales bacterium]|nr:hypothetical protein [Bacillales bacterium]
MSISEEKTGGSGTLTKEKTLVALGLAAGAYGLMKAFKKKKVPDSKAVVVLGSGRSGTSVLARAINIAGVNLGSTFIKPNPTNPKGFFENGRIVKLHKKICSQLKKRPFPKGFQSSKEIRPIRDELKSYIQK